jgi:head-tail adaptor
MPGTGAGPLREQLVIQENAPDALVVTSLTRVTTTATLVTAVPHNYLTGDFVTVAGASVAGWNSKVKIVVASPNSLTFTAAGTLPTPATGAITVTYFSDAQGGKKIGWAALGAPWWAEMIPLSAMERLQAQSLSARVDYRFRGRVRSDITATMRALWTPSWPAPPGAAPQHTLEIHGALPWQDGRTFMVLECGEVVA